MYMATIYGWREVRVFSNDAEKAKKLAVKVKKKSCRDDLEKWNWDACEEYYGADVTEIKDGLVIKE